MVDLKKVAETIAFVGPQSGKTILASLLGLGDVTPAVGVLESNGVPNYSFPESAVRALAAMSEIKRWIDRPRTEEKHFEVDLVLARKIIGRARQAGLTNLSQTDAMSLLSAYGLPAIKTEFARTRQQAVALAKKIGLPVTMKIVSPDVVHKTDIGAVKLDLNSEKDVGEAVDAIINNVKTNLPVHRTHGGMLQHQS